MGDDVRYELLVRALTRLERGATGLSLFLGRNR